jgi:hypothetical protein
LNKELVRGTYTKYTGGTKFKDVPFKNPQIGYTITATIQPSGKLLKSTTIRMDEIDMIRQEYITHIASAPSSATNVKVPTRTQVVSWASLGGIGWASGGSTYPYQYVVEDGMKKLWTDFQSAFTTASSTPVPLTDPYAAVRNDPYSTTTYPPYNPYASLATNQTPVVTSAYRNPERNEAIGGAPASRHMLGRALDISVNHIGGYGSKSRGVAFYKAWEVIHGANPSVAKSASTNMPWADFWQLEDGGSNAILKSNAGAWVANKKYELDTNNDGIPDGYGKTGHLHIQDNPNSGVHK